MGILTKEKMLPEGRANLSLAQYHKRQKKEKKNTKEEK